MADSYSQSLATRRSSYKQRKETRGEYMLYDSAEECYEKRASKRLSVEETAEEISEITIPSLFPPRDWVEGDRLYVPNQSVTAGCVNNMANVLALTAFPPGLPMMQYTVSDSRLKAEQQQQPQLAGRIKVALSNLERLHRQRLEATVLRSVYGEYLKNLIVVGNALWKHRLLDFPTCHSMRHYVVKRDSLFRPLYVVLRECMDLDSLSEELQDFVLKHRQTSRDRRDDDTAYIYTCVRWQYSDENPHGEWYLWQEIEGGFLITDSEEDGDSRTEPSPLFPGYMIPHYGHDWARSYCEDFRGDLYQVENDHHSLNDGAAQAGWWVNFVNPAGTTNIDDVRQADSGDVLAGKADDVTILKTDKHGDFESVVTHGESAEKRLQRAFLLYIAIQRSGERVTKEEIVRMAQDIDKAAGGVHTVIAQSSQAHIVRRSIWMHEQEDSSVPKLPKGVVRVSVITGIDALGRSIEDAALQEYGTELATVFTPAALPQLLMPDEFARRKAAAKGIDPNGLVKDAAQQQQDQQQAQQQQLVGQVAGPIASEGAKAAFGQMAANAQQQQQQGAPQNG